MFSHHKSKVEEGMRCRNLDDDVASLNLSQRGEECITSILQDSTKEEMVQGIKRKLENMDQKQQLKMRKIILENKSSRLT